MNIFKALLTRYFRLMPTHSELAQANHVLNKHPRVSHVVTYIGNLEIRREDPADFFSRGGELGTHTYVMISQDRQITFQTTTCLESNTQT